jgi:hypothetical protein
MQVLELREQRTDVEEEIAEEKKLVEAFKKDGDQASKKEKTIQSALEIAEKDLTAFQLDKQRKLNELPTIVPLRLHQIHFFGLLGTLSSPVPCRAARHSVLPLCREWSAARKPRASTCV